MPTVAFFWIDRIAPDSYANDDADLEDRYGSELVDMMDLVTGQLMAMEDVICERPSGDPSAQTNLDDEDELDESMTFAVGHDDFEFTTSANAPMAPSSLQQMINTLPDNMVNDFLDAFQAYQGNRVDSVSHNLAAIPKPFLSTSSIDHLSPCFLSPNRDRTQNVSPAVHIHPIPYFALVAFSSVFTYSTVVVSRCIKYREK